MVADADPTLRAIAKFRDERYWRLPDGKSTILRGVPVFDEHDEFDERKTIKDENGKDVPNPDFGQLKRRFDARKLDQIASNCNGRFQRTGDACPLTLGHTMPGRPEKDQPPIAGYALKFRLGRFGPEQKLAILSDHYVEPAYWNEYLAHPRRSVEIYPKDEIFDPIALLKRTPQRDLGLISAYARFDAPSHYQRDPWIFADRFHYQRGAELVYRYSMEEAPEMAKTFSIPPGGMVERHAKHAIHKNHYVKKRAERYAAEHGEPMPEDDGQLPMKEQYAARRFFKHYMKFCPSMKKAKEFEEAKGKIPKDHEASQYAAEDELQEPEEAAADEYMRAYAKNPMMRYALGLDDPDPEMEPTAGAGAGANREFPPPPPVAGPKGDEGEGGETAMPPENPEGGPELDARHAYTAEQYHKHMMKKDPVVRYMYDKHKQMYDAEHAAGGAPAEPPGAFPSSSNVIPTPGAKPGEPEQFARGNQAVIQYAREAAALKAQNDVLSAEMATIRTERNQARAEAHVRGLEGEGFAFKDRAGEAAGSGRAREVDRYARMDNEAQRCERDDEIRNNYQRSGPPTGSIVPLSLFDEDAAVDRMTAQTGRGQAEHFSRQDMHTCLELAKNEPSYDRDPQAAYAAAKEKFETNRRALKKA